MSNPVKYAVIGLGFVLGAATAAQAQSVSSLPPAGGVPTQSAVTQPYGSSQSYFPKPGGNGGWAESQHGNPSNYSANPADHPYSTSIGPKPGAHSSGVDHHYQTSARDSEPARHPYDSTGMGPRAN